jgi:hypothetical protein
MVELIGDFLPRFKIEAGLIETTAQPLAILRDESRHQTAGNDGAHQKQSVEQAAHEKHADRPASNVRCVADGTR